MNQNPKSTDVEEALDLLSSEVRDEILRIREEGAEAMKKGDYKTAQSVIEFAGKLESFAENVDQLVGRWKAIAEQHDVEPEAVKEIVGKTFFGKARKGTITTNEDFYVPLLQALVMLGGSGKTRQVIDQVGTLMKGKLKPKDLERLTSDPQMVRWRNKVMWARHNLANQLGYMKSDSPRGVWAISDEGRKWLATHQVGK